MLKGKRSATGPRRANLVTLVDEAATALTTTRGFSVDERQTLIALIRDQAQRAHAVDRTCSVVLAQMGVPDFQWPEFDRWHTLFAECGVFPSLWEGLDYRPLRGDPWTATRQAYRTQKFCLLITWLHGLVVTRAEMRAALTRYTARGLSAEITRQNIDLACPVCDPLNHGYVPRESRNVPPFHPGCRCLIVAAHPTTRLA